MKPTELSRQLREGQSPELNNRRWIVGLSLLGVGMAQIVSLYQVGIVKHLPDPPLDVFDSDKVDASDYAYKRFLTPDGFLMLMSYATTAWLAGIGGEKRSQTHPLLSLAMGAKSRSIWFRRQNWRAKRRMERQQEIVPLLPDSHVGFARFVGVGRAGNQARVEELAGRLTKPARYNKGKESLWQQQLSKNRKWPNPLL